MDASFAITSQEKGNDMKMLIFTIGLLTFAFWAGGYHIVWPPTEDQLYGCNVQNQAPNGECK